MTTCHYVLVKFTKEFGLLDVLTNSPQPLEKRKVLRNIYFNVVELMGAMLLIAQKFMNQENDKLCV